MGNNRSRVVPTRSVKILDTHTRARYKNQQELVRFNAKVHDLNAEKNDNLSRLIFSQREVKMKLHELQHEGGQRKFFKKIDRRSRLDSTSTFSASELSDESSDALTDTPNLLMHNLNASMEWEKSVYMPEIEWNTKEKKKTFTLFDALHSQYSSRFAHTQQSFDCYESSILNDRMSLRELTDIMKKSMKISVAKAARDSHVVARRKARAY